ncbi:MAG: SPASM domain-containing protein, partial [Bacteroidota bacterium]
LYNTIAEALIAGADTLLLNRFLPGGRGMHHAQELMLTEAQINEMIQIADEVLTASERFGHVGTELPACIIKYKSSEHLVVGTGCSAATQFFVVGPGGWIRTCNHSPIEMLHFSEIEKLKDHPYWKQFVFKEYHPEMCKSCDVLFHCDGGCREAAHVYRGCADGNDPVFPAI